MTNNTIEPKQIGTPDKPFQLKVKETLVNGKPFFSQGLNDGHRGDYSRLEDAEETHPDDDDLVPDDGTPDRYCAYELSILTGIPQRRPQCVF